MVGQRVIRVGIVSVGEEVEFAQRGLGGGHIVHQVGEWKDGVGGLWGDKLGEAIHWGLSGRAEVIQPKVRWGTRGLWIVPPFIGIHLNSIHTNERINTKEILA
ncbi:hypothetical protein ACLOJK_007488 [Asimina triloba]